MLFKNMTVAAYIQRLFHDHDCVILPGFGGFITSYEGASINKEMSAIAPPFKKIAFNESLKTNDGFLVNEIAVGEEVSKSVALEMIIDFINEVKNGLESQQQFILAGIGRLFYSKEQKIQFEPDNKENYLDASFGLSDLHVKPIEREESEMKKVHPARSRQAVRKKPAAKEKPTNEKKEKNEGVNKLFIVIPIVLLVLVATALSLFYVQDGKYYKKAMAMFGSGISDDESAEHAGVEESHESSDATGHDEDIHSDDHEHDMNHHDEAHYDFYHIIGGVFHSQRNARKLASRHHNWEIIEIDGMYKVSIAKYDSKAEAKEAIGKLRSLYGEDVWITGHSH